MVEKLENLIENEIEFIEQSIISKEFADKFIFLVNRLYHKFNNERAAERKIAIDSGITFESNKILYFDEFGYGKIPEYILPQLKIIENLYYQYSSNNVESLKLNKVVLLNDKCFLTLAPFFYSEEKLKMLIEHVLSLLEKNEIDHYRNRTISIFTELIGRVNLPYSWDLIDKDNNTLINIANLQEYTKDEKSILASIFSDENEIKDINSVDFAVTLSEIQDWCNENWINYLEDYLCDEDGNCSHKYFESEKSNRKTTDLYELISWLEKIDISKVCNKKIANDANKASTQFTYRKPLAKLKNILIDFFKRKGINIDDDKEDRIGRFVHNCFINPKSCKSVKIGPETINFFTKEMVVPFTDLLFFLNSKGVLIIKNPDVFAKILTNELSKVNAPRIKISMKLKVDAKSKLDKIKELENKIKEKTENETKLAVGAGFSGSLEINWE